ncbi:hypothetical protein CPT_Percy19 [Caulobacter phage Percy]|uniref:Uncharacterized protein n=1 Tax=Caulobacter phage Percy TaxID=1701809 RepID=A0A0M3UL63_9CAUD|nr:hypothetical protein CPT_Percy19 [Caulobacter phage Percy]ALF01653.1 hypothetical protein CPT_Percy19 [Caulobacter phage Percy]
MVPARSGRGSTVSHTRRSTQSSGRTIRLSWPRSTLTYRQPRRTASWPALWKPMLRTA